MTAFVPPTEDMSRQGATADEIDRLALRISLADDDEQFEKVIQKSLVFILKYLALYEDHRKKLMELLGDITRRLKCRSSIQVPVQELLLTYNDPADLVFLVNFSHMYIRLGYPRLPFPQQVKLLPILFASLAEDKPICQRDAFLHVTLPFLGNVTPEMVPRDVGLAEFPTHRRFITDFYSLVLLTPYNLPRLARLDGNESTLPDGFNSYDLNRIVHGRFSAITSAEELEKYKVGLVQFYSRHFFPAEESIIPILFGYGDTRHSVVSIAAKELRTLSMIVDWEDEVLLSRLLSWYLGRRREFDPKGCNEPRRPLSATMRIKMGHYLLRSRITLPGLLAPTMVEAALLALESASMSYNHHHHHTTTTAASGSLPMGTTGAPPPPPPPPCHPPPPPPTMDPNPSIHCDGSCGHHHHQPPPPQHHNHLQHVNHQQPTGEEGGPMGTVPAAGGMPTNETAAAAPPPPHSRSSALVTASMAQRKRLAEHGLDLLSHLVNHSNNPSGPAIVAAMRCLINFVYEKTADELTTTRARGFELLSRFFVRDPNYLLKNPAQLPRLFDVLSEENPTELKLAATNCLRRLAITFQDAQRQNHPALRCQLGKLERLLYDNIEKPDPLCRLVAVNFASLIYPSDHIPTRYLILQALGDKDQHVRKEACAAFEQFLDPNIIHDIVYGRVKLPSFVEFVNHDTQHSRKNPFVEVERLIPVVQFIRLCLLATRGGLTAAQEAGLTYETEDEVRYLVNRTVRYFLTIGGSSNTSASGPGGTGSVNAVTGTGSPGSASSTGVATQPQLNPDQAKRSIDTYFRLIQVVIFTRSQHTKESPNFPNYLEEVLVGNTKELITCNKQLFERMNNVLLATPRGANCRHACASVYSVVVMETEAPAQALQTAKDMLTALPTAGTHIDGDSSHVVQGMFMGAAYLLERLFTRHVAMIPTTESLSTTSSQGSGGGKKSKKEKQQQQHQKQLQTEILNSIENLVSLMSGFLIKPNQLYINPLATVAAVVSKDKRSTAVADGGFYVNASVAQSTVAALLEALMVLARAGCLSHLSSGTWSDSMGPSAPLGSSKAALIARIAAYLPSASIASQAGAQLNAPTAQLASSVIHVAQAALRALAACSMGERDCTNNNGVDKGKMTNGTTVHRHPHLVEILKLITETAEFNDPTLHLAVGVSLADCLLGSESPMKRHWYERDYPLVVSSHQVDSAVSCPAGNFLAGKLKTLLTARPGQVQTRPATLAAAFWVMALVRRLGPLPSSLLPDRLIMDLLDEKDESVQCVAVATLGQIYDRSSEEARNDLVMKLTKAIASGEKRQGSPIYREFCNLAHQIGRPDLALSLIVLAIAPPPPPAGAAATTPRNTDTSTASHVGCSLAASVTYAGLVRRLGRALAPALPRLVPRIFVRRFDQARPKLRQAAENVWIGIVSYASNSSSSTAGGGASCGNLVLNGPQQQSQPQSYGNTSLHMLSSEMIGKLAGIRVVAGPDQKKEAYQLSLLVQVEAHFNAIICEIKAQLGFNSPATETTSPTSSSSGGTKTGSGGGGGGGGSSTGTQFAYLRDACCLSIANLTTHPAADRRLAGHLPALLSGLLGLCDEYSQHSSPEARVTKTAAGSVVKTTPPEEAAIAVQKLVIRVLENPCSREAAAGLLPGLLPVIIDRAPWTLSSSSAAPDSDPFKASGNSDTQVPSESRRLALELLLAAARTTRPSALRPALPQLVLAGLHTMSCVHPSLVASLMRQPIHHLHQLHTSATAASAISTMANAASAAMASSSTAVGVGAPSPIAPHLSVAGYATNNKEIQMAEVLRLCVRLIDDVCLSRLIVPFLELIRAGAGSGSLTVSTGSTGGGRAATSLRESGATATATCVFLSHLAALNSSAFAASAAYNRGQTCLRCASTAAVNTHNAPSVPCPITTNGMIEAHDSSDSPDGLSSTPVQQQTHSSPCGSNDSSPSSVLCSPTQGNSSGPADVNQSPTQASELTTAGRCRAVGQKQAQLNMTTSSNGTATTGTLVGGGFASLVPHTGKLLAALLSAIPGACRHPESAGKTVQMEMARTLASLLRFAKDTSVAKVFNRVRSWYLNPEPITCSATDSSTGVSATAGASISHWACARVMHAVAHHCPELFFTHASVTLPLLFISRQSEPDESNTIPRYRYDYYVESEHSLLPHLPVNEASSECPDTGLHFPDASSQGSEALKDLEALRPLWQETWDELMTKRTPAAVASPGCLLSPLLSGPAFASTTPSCSSRGLVAILLHAPMLEHCHQLLQDALLDCASWSVRTQAALTLLNLADQLFTYQASATMVNNKRRPTTRQVLGAQPDVINGLVAEDGLLTEVDVAVNPVQPTGREADVDAPPLEANGCVAEDANGIDVVSDYVISTSTETVDDTDEWTVRAWLSIIQLTTKALWKTKPWPGKIWLLRTARLLALYARKHGLATAEAHTEVVHQLWCALALETRVKRAESIGAGYRAEAFLSLAFFSDVAGKNALLLLNDGTDATTSTTPSINADGTKDTESTDRLANLFQLIVPKWMPADVTTGERSQKSLVVNPELNEYELVLAVRAVGILWPSQPIDDHLNCFAETVALLNFVMTQGSRRVQAASVASVLEILAKLTPDQSAQLVKTAEEAGPGAKPEVTLGLKDLLIRVKRAAENPKSQLLREHALGSVATLLRHPSFLRLCRDQVIQILRTFSNDGVASLREGSADLLKEL